MLMCSCFQLNAGLRLNYFPVTIEFDLIVAEECLSVPYLF